MGQSESYASDFLSLYIHFFMTITTTKVSPWTFLIIFY